MLNTFFSRAGDPLLRVIRNAAEESVRQKNSRLGSEHLLLGLAREPGTVASTALASMKIDAGSTQEQVDQYLRSNELAHQTPSLRSKYYSEAMLRHIFLAGAAHQPKPVLSDMAVQALLQAEAYSHYFGQEQIEPAHLLLGILDLPEAGATKVFEELSANLTFLRRQIMQLMARQMCPTVSVSKLRVAVIEGLKELASKHEASLSMVANLAEKSDSPLKHLPKRGAILHMVCVAHLGEFLYTQVTFQRYLLEETLALLNQRTGPLDKETSAAIISTGAQNIRAEVRAALEYLWSHEFRLIQQMFDDAEHDLIGSIIEDLWWAQSEEIALNQSFASALEDHRRTQLLSLQKRRIELTNRLTKLKDRLDETIRQCFLKRKIQ